MGKPTLHGLIPGSMERVEVPSIESGLISVCKPSLRTRLGLLILHMGLGPFSLAITHYEYHSLGHDLIPLIILATHINYIGA